MTDADAAGIPGDADGEVEHAVGDVAGPADRDEHAPPVPVLVGRPVDDHVAVAGEQIPDERCEATVAGLVGDRDQVAVRLVDGRQYRPRPVWISDGDRDLARDIEPVGEAIRPSGSANSV